MPARERPGFTASAAAATAAGTAAARATGGCRLWLPSPPFAASAGPRSGSGAGRQQVAHAYARLTFPRPTNVVTPYGVDLDGATRDILFSPICRDGRIRVSVDR